MNTQVNKQELIEWIANLSDSATLEKVQSIKESSTGVPSVEWDDLSEEAKASIERGLEDSKAGRVISSEELWAKYDHRL